MNIRKNSSPKKPTTPAMITATTISCTSPLRMWVSSWPSTASISWSLSAFNRPVVTVTAYCRRLSPVANAFSAVAFHDLQLRHRNAARDAEVFQQIIEPRLLLPRHVLAAGDGVDHRFVEEIGDHDPQRGGAGRIGKRRDQVARSGRQVVVDRCTAVDQRPRRAARRHRPAHRSARTGRRAAASNETCSMRCACRDRRRP